MTSQELAKLCGVSKTTVSRVINNDPKVKEVTRQRVLAAMKEYNYVPIASARRLAGIDSRIIGLFVLDINISDSKTRVSKSSYFSQITNLIIDKANNNGFQVLISIITSEQQMEEAKNLFMSRTIFSGIVIGAFDQSKEVDELIALGYPIVVIDKRPVEDSMGGACLFVNLDNYAGAYEATNYLIKLGHRNIGHITGDLRKFSATERLRGYRQAMADTGINNDTALIYEGNFQEESGYRQVTKLMQEKSMTAIFAANDGMAIGAIKGIHEKGYKVPENYSVIGFDSIEIGEYTTPSLSTVYGQFDEVANQCILALEYFIEHDRFEKYEVTIRPELVIRGSTDNIKSESF